MPNKKSRPDIPAGVLLELRQEVAHGCPAPECRNPLLTYHHFDPPWNEIEEQCERDGRVPTKDDHKAAGMIALCRLHHDYADGSGYTRAQLRGFKASKHDAKSVRHLYPWAKDEFLVRVGGAYFFGSEVPIAFASEPVVRLDRGADGLLLVSFAVRDVAGDIALQMVENTFTVEAASLFDLECRPQQQTITGRLASGEIALSLHCKRMSMDEVRAMALDDAESSRKTSARREKQRLESMPTEYRERIAASGVEVEPPAPNGAVERICELAAERCKDDDGLVPVLNFNRLVSHRAGRKLMVANGVAASGITLLPLTYFVLEPGPCGTQAVLLG